MAQKKTPRNKGLIPAAPAEYGSLVAGISQLLDQARRDAARMVNRLLTATYWHIGRQLVEFDQAGKSRAVYGEALLKRLAQDLTAQHGRGFSERNLENMRSLYLGWEISQTPSAKLVANAKCPGAVGTPARMPPSPFIPAVGELAAAFPLSWSHYVRLLAVENLNARSFYETEAMRGGWSVRQLDRQIGSQFYERTALSKNKASMLEKGQHPKPEDTVSAREEIRDPYLLEFLDLKDEYSETDLEEALIRHLEWFLLELGTGFTFVARQKRIRIGDEWYRIDLLLFHRVLRCLVLLDLKTGRFTHADAGQMNLYLNYAKEHLVLPGEAEPIGLILCTAKNDAVVKYATGGINTQVFASKYLIKLPDESVILAELEKTRRLLDSIRTPQQPQL
jgi:predicted nuclease of restriction endonuclease-like (RecB) superfamily